MSKISDTPLGRVDVTDSTVDLNAYGVKVVLMETSHVNALTNALEALVKDACANYDMCNRTSVYNANKALAAYRGEK